MKKYIERVESTLKGGCEVQLGYKTVIVGPNGSGKSTIIQAIELATCGLVSDTEGRDKVKQTQALARLFPLGAKRYAHCRLSTGEEFSWAVEDGDKKGSYKKPVHKAPVEITWPFQDLQAVLSGDAASVQAWLEKQVFGTVPQEEALERLPPAIRPTVKELMERKGQTDFLGLAKGVRTEAKNLRAQATRLESTIDSLLEGIAPPLQEETRNKLRQAVAKQAAQGSQHVSQKDYDFRELKIHELASQVATFKNAIAQEPGSDLKGKVEVLRQVKAALSLITAHHETFQQSPLDYCWVCGSEGKKEHEEQLRGVVEALSEAVAYEDRCTLAKTRCAALEADLEREVGVFKTLQVKADTPDAQLLLLEDAAVRRSWKNAEASRKEAAQLRAKADLLTSAAKSLTSVGKDMLSAAKIALESCVSSFLPEGDEFQVDLANARVGLVREGEIHSALSGAEWSRVLLALASSVERGSTLSVLVPGDRAWDRDTLSRMMVALAGSEAQIIVMSTVKPDPVEGWTLVDLT